MITFTTLIVLGTRNVGSLSPRKTEVGPPRDTYWDISRLWCYSLGYESLTDGTGPTAGLTNDPYFTQHGQGNNTIDTQANYINPLAMFYRNSIGLDKLVQPYYFVPRTFEPIVLQQILRIGDGEHIIMFAAEILGSGATPFARAGRGVAFGFDYEETLVKAK